MIFKISLQNYLFKKKVKKAPNVRASRWNDVFLRRIVTFLKKYYKSNNLNHGQLQSKLDVDAQ